MIKSLTLKFRRVEGRRVACDRCGKVFTFLAESIRKQETYGVSVVSSRESMEKALLKGLVSTLRAIPAKKRTGEATCPGCRRYQKWMVWNSRMRLVPRWLVGAWFAVVFGSVFLLTIINPSKTGPMSPTMRNFVLLGPIPVGLALGLWRSLNGRPLNGPADERSATDEEIRELVQYCRNTDEAPLAAWQARVHEASPVQDMCVWSGFVDEVGDPPWPDDWGREEALADLARLAAEESS